ncbi:unnamed protein product, partial [Scytosiphon promiscuus]
EAENSCPSRRSIIEAVTSVLAPHLSEQAEQLAAAAATAAAAAATATAAAEKRAASGSGGEREGGGGSGLSASAFVHGGGQPAEAAAHAEEQNDSGGGKLSATAAAAAAIEEAPSSLLRDRDGQEWWAAARPHLFDFVAKYLELSLVSVGPRLTNAVLVSVAATRAGGGGGAGDGGSDSAVDAQARLVTLLQRVPLSLVDRGRLLPLAEKSRFFRAAVILLKAAVTLGEQRGFNLEQFSRIVRCYLQDPEDAYRCVMCLLSWLFPRACLTRLHSEQNHSDSIEPDYGCSGCGNSRDAFFLNESRLDVVLSRLPQLMELNKAEAVFTVGEAFRGDHKAALAALATTTTLQFEYLDALLRPSGPQDQDQGTGSSSPSPASSAGPSSFRRPVSSALAAGLDDADRSLHVRLLVRFRPYEVYPFLSSSTGYSLDDTLALCQERGVADATAYLLERKGDVPGALALALRTLSARLASLRTALQGASLRELAAEMAFSSSSSSSSPAAAGTGARGLSSPSPLSPSKRFG